VVVVCGIAGVQACVVIGGADGGVLLPKASSLAILVLTSWCEYAWDLRPGFYTYRGQPMPAALRHRGLRTRTTTHVLYVLFTVTSGTVVRFTSTGRRLWSST
jgi:hypothetical protein